MTEHEYDILETAEGIMAWFFKIWCIIVEYCYVTALPYKDDPYFALSYNQMIERIIQSI